MISVRWVSDRRPASDWRMIGFLVLGFLVAVAGCSLGAKQLTGAEQEAVLRYAEPMTDNLLAGFNAGDYPTFSRDFNAKMREALNEAAFEATRAKIVAQIGGYVSREVSRVEEREDSVVVIYRARFEQEDGVTVRVVFESASEHRITGLWFDSPKLRR